MRTRWIKYVIWLMALSASCAMGAVIQHPESSSSAPQHINSTASIIEKNRERLVPKVATEALKNVSTETPETSFRNEKAQSNATAIGESIKMVASQLLHSNKTPPPPSTSGKQGAITDTRTPPLALVKNPQVVKKVPNKPIVKPDEPKRIENSHAGVAIPVSPDEVEKEMKHQNNKKKQTVKESSTTSEGLSTWVLVNGKPSATTLKPEVKNKNDSKVETSAEKENKKPVQNKPKPKPTRSPSTPQIKPIFVRKPVAISSNKSDLIASGSAVNENEMNKIKASVLANVQKNAALGKTTPSSETVVVPTTENIKSVNDKIKDSSKEIMIKISQVNLKDKKKAEAKEKLAAKDNEIAKVDDQLQDESVESKHAEIELPVSTPAPAPKPKSKKKKNKNRRRKPTTSSTNLETKEDDTKVKNKIKVNKNDQNSTNIYNFISRKVIPSVGIGLVSLAGLFGIASYFFNPFTTLRRSDNMIERKDLYHYNEEQYADDGGQREEDVLGNLFSDVPANNKGPNPNVHQNPNRYPLNPTQFTYPKPKKSPSSTEQNIRYRNVGYSAESSNFVSNDRIGQKTPDIVQGSTYSENIHYDTHSSGNREPYAVYPQPQPVYKAPDRQVDNSEYGADVYHAISPYAGHHSLSDATYGQSLRYNQEMFETTSKAPISNVVHINNEDVIEHQKETGYTVDALNMDDEQEPQFVVGNVPKELIQATPVTVPEHGPRSLKIRKRSVDAVEQEPKIESAAESLKQILSTAQRRSDDEMDNEIDDVVVNAYKKDMVNLNKYLNSYRNETIEENSSESTVTENTVTESSTKANIQENVTESTTSTSSKPSTETPNVDNKDNETPALTTTTSTESTKEEEYPYTNYDHQYPILDFIRGFIDFKLRLGISILKATSENLARYLKDVESNFNITKPQVRSRFR